MLILRYVVGPVNDPSLNTMPLYKGYYSFYASPDLTAEMALRLPVIAVPDALDIEGRTMEHWISRSRYSKCPLLSLSSFEVCAEFASGR